MSKPKFDPSQPFQAVKPKFDPSQPYSTEEAKTSDTPSEEPGRLEALGSGLAQGATFGLSDELAGALAGSPTGAAKTIANLVGGTYNDEDVAAYKARRDISRQENKAAEEAHGGYALGGNLVGGAIPMALAALATGGAAPAAALAGEAGTAGLAAGEAAPAIAQAIGKSMVMKGAQAGALGGATYGAGQSEAENLGGLFKDTTAGGVMGGVTGGLASQFGKLLTGNAADIASGAATKSSSGLLGEFGESKFGKIMSGLYEKGKAGESTSPAAIKELSKESKEAAQTALGVARQNEIATGKEIGAAVAAKGEFKPDGMDEALELITRPDANTLNREEYGNIGVLKNVIDKFAPEGNLISDEAGRNSAVFRNKMFAISNANPDTKVGEIAEQLAQSTKTFRQEASGELASEFHDLKSFAEMVGADTTDKFGRQLDKTIVNNKIADALASKIENAEGSNSMKSGRFNDILDQWLNANNNDPKMVEAINVMKRAKNSADLIQFKDKMPHSLYGLAQRAILTMPAEYAGKIAGSSPGKFLGKAVGIANDYVLHGDADMLRSVAQKSKSPVIAKYINQAADATDDSKKRAILNVLNQMPAFRNMVKGLLPGKDEE